MKRDFSSQIKKLQISTRRKVFSMLIGNYVSSFKGQGIEFDDIREYVPGDNVRDIDWNSTAKSAKIYVRKYIETRELTILLLIDVSSSMNFGTDESLTKVDVMTQFILCIALAAERSNDRVGAVFYTDKIEKSLDFKKGKVNTIKIVKETLNFFGENRFKNSNPENALSFLINGAKKRTITFFISDGIEYANTKVRKLLKSVNKKHELIFVNVQDSLTKLLDTNDEIILQDIETGQTKYVDLTDSDVVNKIRQKKIHDQKELKNFCTKNGIGYLYLDERSDILMDAVKFFKLRKHKSKN